MFNLGIEIRIEKHFPHLFTKFDLFWTFFRDKHTMKLRQGGSNSRTDPGV